jgi:hypothetical protein
MAPTGAAFVTCGAPERRLARPTGAPRPRAISAFEWMIPEAMESVFHDDSRDVESLPSTDRPERGRVDEQLRTLAEVPGDATLTPSRVWLYGGAARSWKPGALVAVPDGAQLWPGEILCVMEDFALVEYEHDTIGHTALRLVRTDGAPIVEAPDPQQNIAYADCPIELRMAIRAADLDWAGKSVEGDVPSLFDPARLARDRLVTDHDASPASAS